MKQAAGRQPIPGDRIGLRVQGAPFRHGRVERDRVQPRGLAMEVDPLDDLRIDVLLLPNGHSRMVTPFSAGACRAVGMADWADWKMTTRPGHTVSRL